MKSIFRKKTIENLLANAKKNTMKKTMGALDLIMFGEKTSFGIKFTGVGHDGESDSKKAYLDSRGKALNTSGFYGEVSGKLAAILMGKYGATSVNNKEDVEKVLGKPVEWNGKNPEDASAKGDGWYTRDIGGTKHAKILLGKPKSI